MEGLLKYLPPLAPDQSGAVSALYEMGGLIVICDAGGCTGNICGFDEPRWFEKKSAVFSAGLRDMDAILGRDERLVAKLADAAAHTDTAFTAIIGTPVPAVIATDFQALRRAAEKATGLPAVAVETTGTGLYDKGEEAALAALFQTFATEAFPVHGGTLGVLGATPLDFGGPDAGERIEKSLRRRGWKNVVCYGMGSGLDRVRRASSAEKNLVVSPAGLKTAEYLQQNFGTPFSVGDPFLPEEWEDRAAELDGKRVLVIHQQVLANALRRKIRETAKADVTVASWFMLKPGLAQAGDFRLTDERQFARAVMEGGYDVIVGDRLLRRALRQYRGEFLDLPHFAVSGRRRA